jgi:hypothetical protein
MSSTSFLSMRYRKIAAHAGFRLLTYDNKLKAKCVPPIIRAAAHIADVLHNVLIQLIMPYH